MTYYVYLLLLYIHKMCTLKSNKQFKMNGRLTNDVEVYIEVNWWYLFYACEVGSSPEAQWHIFTK